MLALNSTLIETTLLVSVRIGTLLVFTPIQAIHQLPLSARLIFTLIISGLFVNNLSLSSQALNKTQLLAGALTEFGNGLILAMSIYAAFSVFQIAGQLIETQMGLNTIHLFNPSEYFQEPLTSRLFSILAILLFFLIEGHHRLLEGLAYSFTLIPPGQLQIFHNLPLVIKEFSFMFSLALSLASPVIIGLLLIDFSSALITRTMPQINAYFSFLPIKIVTGLTLITLLLHYIEPILRSSLEQSFQTWAVSL